MGSWWVSTNTWKLPKGKFPAFIKMPIHIFYSLAYGTAYKTLQPSRMPVMQIEFCIPAVGYSYYYLELFMYFGRSCSHSSLVQYGHLFIITREDEVS